MTRPGELNFPADQRINDELKRVFRLLRGGLNLHDNVTRSHIVSYTHTSGNNSPQTINITALKLSWVPLFFILVHTNDETTIWATAADQALWTPAQIVLHCARNNVALKVMVF
jgi:predicted short-subunit dehydrogenase-like oxidoreductase (DUF2520 family)